MWRFGFHNLFYSWAAHVWVKSESQISFLSFGKKKMTIKFSTMILEQYILLFIIILQCMMSLCRQNKLFKKLTSNCKKC